MKQLQFGMGGERSVCEEDGQSLERRELSGDAPKFAQIIIITVSPLMSACGPGLGGTLRGGRELKTRPGVWSAALGGTHPGRYHCPPITEEPEVYLER